MHTSIALLLVLSTLCVDAQSYLADETSLLQTRDVVVEDRNDIEGHDGCCFAYNEGVNKEDSYVTLPGKGLVRCMKREYALVQQMHYVGWKKDDCPTTVDQASKLWEEEKQAKKCQDKRANDACGKGFKKGKCDKKKSKFFEDCPRTCDRQNCELAISIDQDKEETSLLQAKDVVVEARNDIEGKDGCCFAYNEGVNKENSYVTLPGKGLVRCMKREYALVEQMHYVGWKRDDCPTTVDEASKLWEKEKEAKTCQDKRANDACGKGFKKGKCDKKKSKFFEDCPRTCDRENCEIAISIDQDKDETSLLQTEDE